MVRLGIWEMKRVGHTTFWKKWTLWKLGYSSRKKHAISQGQEILWDFTYYLPSCKMFWFLKLGTLLGRQEYNLFFPSHKFWRLQWSEPSKWLSSPMGTCIYSLRRRWMWLRQDSAIELFLKSHSYILDFFGPPFPHQKKKKISFVWRCAKVAVLPLVFLPAWQHWEQFYFIWNRKVISLEDKG